MPHCSDIDRLAALRDTQLLDSPPEPAFDRLTRLAAGLLGAPVALLSLVDEGRQFFKSAHGLAEPWASRRETPLSHSFCLHAIRGAEPLVVADAREHPVLRDSLAIRELAAIAYAGIPLVVAGATIGAFCVIDDHPRVWSEDEVRLLQDLAASVVSEIELRLAMRSASEQRALTEALLEGLGDGVLAIDTRRTFIAVNSVARAWFETAAVGEPLPADWSTRFRSFLPDGTALAPEDGALARALRGMATHGLTFTLQGPSAEEPVWLEASGRPVRNAAGQVVAAVSVYRDVTGRLREAEQRTSLQAQLAVRERDQSLAAVLDSIGDAVIVSDRDGLVRRMNPVAETLTGWSLVAAEGRPLGEVLHVSEDADQGSMLEPRVGERRPVAQTTTPIAVPGAPPTGVVVVFRDTTAERTQRAALAQSELKYRELYENAPDMYMTLDVTTETILDCNQTLCDQLGYDKAELLGQPFYSVYHADYLDTERARRAKLATLQETGRFVDVERRLRRKDGSSIDVSLNMRGVRDAHGDVVRAAAVWRDITRRKQAERDRTFLVELGDVLRVSTIVPDVLRAVAVELGRHLGVERCFFAEIDAPSDRISLHPGYADGPPPLLGTLTLSRFGQAILAESASGATVVIEDAATDARTASAFEAAYRPAGIVAAISASQLRDGDLVATLVVSSSQARAWEGREAALVRLVAERVWQWVEHLRVLGALRDRQVAEAVHRTEERFRTLVDGVKDYAIFLLDARGNVETWNSGAERLKGYRAGEILGQPYELFFTEEERARGRPASVLDQARRLGRFEEEAWRVRQDGTRFMAHVVLTALRSADGSLDGFAKVTRDVTERRAQDDELAAKQTALARSLKEREVLLQEVHHRVKNNLQVISSLINMQGRQLEPGPARAALEECQSRVLTIALIHEKLYQSNDYARVRFADYARSLAENVFHAIGRSPGEVTLDLAIDDLPLRVDKAIPCGLIINELITNSLKHAFPGGRQGTIRVGLASLDNELMTLTVADDGIGLPQAFDVAASSSMGLQLVVTLAEQLEATMVVSGAAGARFTLTFAGEGQ